MSASLSRMEQISLREPQTRPNHRRRQSHVCPDGSDAPQRASRAGWSSQRLIGSTRRAAFRSRTRSCDADEVHRAWFLAELHTSNRSASASSSDLICHVIEDRVEHWFRPRHGGPPRNEPGNRLARVELVAMITAGEATALHAGIDTFDTGLVIAGFGRGPGRPWILGYINGVITRVICVIVAFRCVEGSRCAAPTLCPAPKSISKGGRDDELQDPGSKTTLARSGRPSTRLAP